MQILTKLQVQRLQLSAAIVHRGRTVANTDQAPSTTATIDHRGRTVATTDQAPSTMVAIDHGGHRVLGLLGENEEGPDKVRVYIRSLQNHA